MRGGGIIFNFVIDYIILIVQLLSKQKIMNNNELENKRLIADKIRNISEVRVY